MAGAGSKRNLSAAEQVAFLRNEKGVSFSLASEADAVKILSHGICLYRLKAYAADFDTYHEKGVRHGRYIGLDFGHLVELEVLDSRLRTLVLSFCLDIEEALKVRINRAAMEADVDPYALTRGYLEAARAGVVSDQLVRYDREAAEPAMSRAAGILAGADPSDPAEAMDAVNAAMTSWPASRRGGTRTTSCAPSRGCPPRRTRAESSGAIPAAKCPIGACSSSSRSGPSRGSTASASRRAASSTAPPRPRCCASARACSARPKA